MNQFYRLSTLLLLLFTVHASFATMADNSNAAPYVTPSSTEALAPGDLTATITGAVSFCAGSAGTIVFEGAGGSSPYTFTYRVGGGSDQTISTTALSSSVNVPVNTSSAGDLTYRITSVKGATGKATLVDISRMVTILAAPVVDFSFSGSACSGTMVPFTTSVQGAGMFSYLWDFGDGQTSTEQNPSHVFTSTGCGTEVFTVGLTVTDGNGCSATRNRSVSVLQKPDISFSDLNFPFGDPFNNCGSASASSPDYTISVGNTSLSAGCVNSYSINWGDGAAPVANASFPASHTYKSVGAFDMVITAFGANGCSNSITYVVKNLNNPSVGITSPGTTTNLCAPTAPLMFEIAKWGTNAPGTTYRVDYGDGSPVLTFTQEQLKASPYFVSSNPSASANFPIPHSYVLPNCPNGPYMVRLTATNACSSTEATVNNITVYNKTTPDFTVAAHACVNSSVLITNTSIPGYNTSCNQTSIYTWDFGDGTAQEVTTPTLPKNTNHTYTTPGQYTIKLTSKNICGESTITRQIIIDPPLAASVTGTGMVSGTVNVCQDAPMPVITFTGTNGTAPYTFTYRINNGPLQTITTAPGSSSVILQVPTGTTGSFIYKLVSISDASPTACTQAQTGSLTVVVMAPPSGTLSGNTTACLNDASPVITFTGSGGTRPYTFTYNINGGPVQTISTSGSSNSVTLAVPTTSAGVFRYNLIGVQDSGAATCSKAVSATTVVTISQSPAPMTLPNHEYCNGETTPVINFTNVVAGTTYRWTNSNSSIGLAASGNGSIPSFTARNSTGAPVTAVITVTPSVNGCDGASQTFTITVYPSAVTFSRGAQTICTGDNTVQVTLSSPTGAALSWSATVPAGITGAVTSGTTLIPVQTLVNSTGAPLTVTYTAIAALPASDPCAGTQYGYSITVNPRPVVLQIFNLEVCSGSAFSVSPQTNAQNSIPSGTRYTWSAPVISPAGAITGAGAQATPQAAISQTLVNTTSSSATATYTVTPVANGCAGASFTIVVTVIPLPSATVSGSATVCQDAAMPLVTFTGSNGTAPYTFTYKINSGASRTIVTSSGSSASVQAPTDMAGTFTYTLVSVQDAGPMACVQGQSGSAVITIQPNPSATLSGNATVCSNSPSPLITFTGSGGTRPYTFSYNMNGGAVQSISTSASSSSVTLPVPTTAAGVFTYNLTGVQDAAAGTCSRTVNATATVTVKESPAAITLTDHEYCNGETTAAINFSNTVAGTTYQWTNSNTSIGLAASGTGSIASFTALNATSSAITSTITVIPSVNGCNGAAQSFRITVQPSPVVTFSIGSQTICTGSNTTQVTLGSSTAGAQFSWSVVPPAGITGVVTSGTNTIPVQTLVNSTNAPITVTYKAKAATSGTLSCLGNEATYAITVNPKAQIDETFAETICSGSAFSVSPQNNADNSIPSNTKYTWSAPVISLAGAITGAGAQATPQASISQTLVNTTSSAATATYSVTPVVNGCAGASFTIVVTVVPLPSAVIAGSATVCKDAPMPLVTFTGSNGTAPYTFTYKINNGAVQTITTDPASSSVSVEVPTGITGSFTYTLVNVTDGSPLACTRVQTGSVTVVISAPPTGTIAGSNTACINDASLVTFTGSGGTRPYTFTYNINGGAAQSISTSGISNNVTVAVPTSAAGVFTYNLTGVQDAAAGTCSSAVAASATVTVAESPAAITLTDHEYCKGETTAAINFSNTVAGTTYQWTNSNTSIGLAASGTGSIASFTALNATSSAIISTITVIPSVNGCNGAAQSFRITVQPSPVITFSAGAQAICSGESTSVITLGSSTTGAQFSWSAVQPAGITGVVTSGTNTIPVQTLVNSTSAPITVTYKAKAATSGTLSCLGNEATYTITVNPKAQIDETFAETICSGSAFSIMPQTSADNSIPSGTSYTWSAPVVSPAGAITGAGAQAIPQASISQTLVNTTSSAATATYSVTPVVNGCADTTFTIVVTVLPISTVNPLNELTLCHGEQGAAIVFTGTGVGTVYQWTSDNPSIGIAAMGSDRIGPFTAVNTGNSPVQSTITVTPIQSNGNVTCEGTPVQFLITVNPAAQVDAIADQKVCSGDDLSVSFTTQNTGGSTTYQWTNSNTAIGLSASGSSPLSFTPVNTGNTTLSAVITVTPLFTNNGVSCQGSPKVFTINVDPAATVVKPADQKVCNGYLTDEIRFNGNTAGSIYQWTTDNTTIGLPASGTASILPFTAVNNGTAPVVATITATPVFNGCSGTAESFTITVNPTPVITSQPVGSIVCLGEKPSTMSVAAGGGGSPSYQWYSNTTAATSGGVLIPNATGASYDPPAAVAGTVYYYCVITFSNDGCSGLSSAVAEVTIHPNPVISALDQEISSGETFSVTPTWGNGNIVPTGTAYVWSDPVVSPAGAVSGATAQPVPQAVISQRLVNTTLQSATVTYTVFPVSGACTGASFKVTVYVDSPLTPNMILTPIACYGENNGSITTNIQGGAPFAQGAPYTLLWTGPNGFTSTDVSIYNLAPGLYHLTVTDSRGKQISAEITITAPKELMVVTDEKKDVSCYGASDGRILITVEGGTKPYQTEWTRDAMPFASTEDLSTLSPGTYEVTVRDANGCAPKIMSWVIVQPEPLTITLKGKSDIRCFGDSAGFIAVEVAGGVPAYQYRWTGPEGFNSTDEDLSRLVAGDYTLLVTDAAGCTQSLAVTLTEPSPLAVATQTTPISCYGANNATIRINISGGTPPYEAEWDNYAMGTYQDNLSAGVYTILITDASQCQISTTVNIPEAPVFRMNPEVKNVSCYGARDGSISLNFETTLKSVILIWSDNVRSGTTRNNIGPGVYTVKVQGGSLCMLNRTFVITEPSPMVLTAAVTDITDCNIADGGAIDLMATGGTPPYRYTWSNGALTEDLNNLQAGNYAITVTDFVGCAQVAQYTVKRPAPLVMDVKTITEHDCASGDIKAISTAKVSGGVTPYQLNWSAGEVSGSANEQMETRQSGIFTLTVTDQTGCSITRSFSIDLPDPGIVSRVADCNAHAFQFEGKPAIESPANSYHWDFGDGTGSDLRNPQHIYQAPGTYNVRLMVTNGECVSVYQEVVNAEVPPLVGIDKDPRFCPGDSILIHGTGAATYRWNDGTNGDSIWISREGDYSVTGTSASGCEATYRFRASYYDLIGYTIHSDQQEVSSAENRIHFWSENIPFSNYHWDFGDSQSGQGVETFHSYEISDDGYFDVTLSVINPHGCEEVATKRIWKSVTAIANTFTPNSDGINDIYLKGWQIQVFNRNGILMYQGDTGWDGKHDGRLVDNDTYFVIIYDSTELGAKYKKSYVTVLR